MSPIEIASFDQSIYNIDANLFTLLNWSVTKFFIGIN